MLGALYTLPYLILTTRPCMINISIITPILQMSKLRLTQLHPASECVVELGNESRQSDSRAVALTMLSWKLLATGRNSFSGTRHNQNP